MLQTERLPGPAQDETSAERVLSHSLSQHSSEVQLPRGVHHPQHPGFYVRPMEVVKGPQQLVRSPGLLDGQLLEQRQKPACSGSGSGSGSDCVARLTTAASSERQQPEQWQCYGHCGANVRHFCQRTRLIPGSLLEDWTVKLCG